MADRGLSALGTLQAPSGTMDLVRFEESLVEHLSRFSAALEAEVDRLADRLGHLEETVAGAEQGMERIDRQLTRMHAFGQVRMLPLDHVSLQPRAGSGAKVPPIASSGAQQPGGGSRQAGAGGVSQRGGLSRADVDAILLGVSNMNLSPMAGPTDPRELWLPPPLTSQGKAQGPCRGTQNPQTAQSSDNGGTSRGRNQEQGAGSDTGSFVPRDLGPDSGNAGAGTVVEEDALFGAAEQGEQAREERLWEAQPGGQAQTRGWDRGGAEWREPAMAPSRREQGPSSGDLLEPSASAVRGFRALLEAALRAPGAFGDDEQWAPHEVDNEERMGRAESAADGQWPDDHEGVGGSDWLGREDSPSGLSSEHGGSGFSGQSNDEGG